jgi:hypothetical protein
MGDLGRSSTVRWHMSTSAHYYTVVMREGISTTSIKCSIRKFATAISYSDERDARHRALPERIVVFPKELDEGTLLS